MVTDALIAATALLALFIIALAIGSSLFTRDRRVRYWEKEIIDHVRYYVDHELDPHDSITLKKIGVSREQIDNIIKIIKNETNFKVQ